jgi:hypothetical protein
MLGVAHLQGRESPRLALGLLGVGSDAMDGAVAVVTRNEGPALAASGRGKGEGLPGGDLSFQRVVPASIVGAGVFHCRVRDGNGWDNPALTTRKPLASFGSPEQRLWTFGLRRGLGPALGRFGSSGARVILADPRPFCQEVLRALGRWILCLPGSSWLRGLSGASQAPFKPNRSFCE